MKERWRLKGRNCSLGLRQLVLAGIVCACLGSMGVSLAYRTDHAELTNEFDFVGEKGMDAILTEPSWNPENARLLLPGETCPKDPQVTNTSEEDLDELVALKLEFVYGEDCPDAGLVGCALSPVDMACVYDAYEIDWNADGSGDWVRFDGETAADQTQHFYYRDVLERNLPEEGDTTVPLFTYLCVPEDVNNERYARIQEMGGFDIRISGMAVQQMSGETVFGLNSAKEAYEAELFAFDEEGKGE